MADLVVIVPSRGRPEAAAELVETFRETCTADTRLVFAVDDDDPSLPGYLGAIQMGRFRAGYFTAPNRTMVEALNRTAAILVDPPDAVEPFAIGFMGDDHRPRTVGWDRAYLDALRELGTGIVYGDDGFQGENLPTQVAMTADIVRALGWMAPPSLRHLFVDNVWKALGSGADCLRYLPEVLVEHMHPVAGKADVDEGYVRVNAPAVASHDEAWFRQWLYAGAASADIATVRGLRTGAVPEVDPSVHEWRLFDEGTVPEFTQPGWYAERAHAPHLEEGHRPRLEHAAAFIAQIALTRGLRSVVDLGAGDGGLLSLLGPAFTAWGYDLVPENIRAAKERGVDVRYGDVINSDVEWADIVVCTEMLEHLIDPHGFLRSIPRHVKALVCSSPWDERPGAAYAFHTWAWDLDGYRSLVEQAGFKVQRQRPVDRFQVLLAVKP
jgi:hypothetical protein